MTSWMAKVPTPPAPHQPQAFNEVPSLMQVYFAWLYTSVTGVTSPFDTTNVDLDKKIHPLIISGITHHLIGYIHLFLRQLQRYDRIKHIRELLGKGHAKTSLNGLAGWMTEKFSSENYLMIP
ncbi:hypothetical protein KDC22_27925 [Paenibacillus tritici]|uniref:hypothetical protein n=1 Tax=Paenibacillus tritici TaxID=1873425 RepID=UPI001BA890C9|nr:hypothetical protein [Paenibacillus tritici]QUL54124.1 hypothetical protein KDC22_27925 [Paenibacillus tritici]